MHFELDADQDALREGARRFIRAEMMELAREIEATNEPLSKAWLRRLGELGFLGVNISREYGGLGLGALDAILIIEEFAKVHPGMGFPVFESCVGPVRAIEQFGTESLKQRVIPEVCRGERIVAVAMSEPEAGTALTDLRTRAVPDGESMVLNGTKRWSSGGGHADGYLVYCRMSEEAPGAKGIGAVYVENGSRGLSFGAREQLMGFRGVYSADIILDNVRVPRDCVVVQPGGFSRLMTSFGLERCGNAAMCLGIAEGALDDILLYVQERKQFGKHLAEFQAVQLKLAEIAMQVEAARLLIYKAATRAGKEFPSIVDSLLAKCFANEMVREVTGKAMQLMGAYGYSKQYPMEQKFRDAWGWGIAGGAIDIQKVNIASALIGRRFDQRAR